MQSKAKRNKRHGVHQRVIGLQIWDALVRQNHQLRIGRPSTPIHKLERQQVPSSALVTSVAKSAALDARQSTLRSRVSSHGEFFIWLMFTFGTEQLARILTTSARREPASLLKALVIWQ